MHLEFLAPYWYSGFIFTLFVQLSHTELLKKWRGKWKFFFLLTSETRALNGTATTSIENVLVRKKIITEKAPILVLYLVYQM